MPAEIAATVSTHTDVPVEHDVAPATHGFGFVEQLTPAVHAVHAPPLQTASVPQVVPFAFAAPSTQTDVPVEHEVVPSWQSGSGFAVQATPAVHAVHVPPLQTWFVPQDVPFALATASMQVSAPVAHEEVPA